MVGEEARAAGGPPGPGVTPQRMLRELAEALEACTAAHPLLLVLEDLHWSDASTVEALTLLARRREAARLLVIGTYRPVELILRQHPLKAAKQELQLHGHCADVPLGYLPVAAVQAYLAQRGPAAAATAEWAAWVHRRTDGQPLFMVHVVEELARSGGLTAAPAPEAAGRGAAAEVPAGLQQLIELQLGQLDAEEQQVLEVASVVGAEFAEASVAAGLPLPLDAIAARCEGLAQRGQFIEDRGLAAWPDGTVSGRYGFRHALYQEVLYGRLGSGRRMRCHRAIGTRLEAAYGAQVAQSRGGAGPALRARARRRSGRCSIGSRRRRRPPSGRRYHGGDRHLTQGLALLATLPETPARAQQELDFQLALAPALSDSQGPGGPRGGPDLRPGRSVVRAGRRDPPALARSCWAHWFHSNREELSTAREMGEQLARWRRRRQARGPPGWPTAPSAFTAFYLGDYGRAAPGRRGSPYRPTGAAGPGGPLWLCAWGGVPELRGEHAVVSGLPGPGLRQSSQEALALAQELAHPFSLAFVHLRPSTALPPPRGPGGPGAGRGPADAGDGAGVSAVCGARHFCGDGRSPVRVSTWGAWPDAAGPGGLPATGEVAAALSGLLVEASGQAGYIEEGLRLLTEALDGCAPAGEGMDGGGYGSRANYSSPALTASGRHAVAAAARPKPACSRPAVLPAASRPNPGNYGRPRAWRGCGSARASGTTPARYWHRSTAGSLRASTPPTCRRPRRCWRNWRDPMR